MFNTFFFIYLFWYWIYPRNN